MSGLGDDVATDDAQQPDWLSGIGEAQPEAAEASDNWISDLDDDNTADDWISDLGDEVATDDAQQPDWLSSMGDAGQVSDDAPAPVRDATTSLETPSWMAAFTGEELPEEDPEPTPIAPLTPPPSEEGALAEESYFTDNSGDVESSSPDDESESAGAFDFDFGFEAKPAWMRESDEGDEAADFTPPWMRDS
jgi:hypothetical protein